MSYLVAFETKQFNSAFMPLSWLKLHFERDNIDVREVETFEWGYSILVTFGDIDYELIIVFLLDESEIEEYQDAIISIDKNRTLLDRLLFRNKINKDDILLEYVQNKVRLIPDAREVKVQYVA